MKETIVLIGCGYSGTHFLRELACINAAINEVVIVDPNVHAVDFITPFPLRWHRDVTTVSRMLLQATLVLLCVPPYVQSGIIAHLKQVGVSRLLIEKPGPIPFGANYRYIKNMEDSGTQIGISHQRQYAAHFEWALKQLQENKIGSVLSATVTLQKHDFITAGTHWAALIHSMFGPVVHIEGWVSFTNLYHTKYGYPIETAGEWRSTHANSMVVTWHRAAGSRSDLQVFGTSGTLGVKCPEKPLAYLETAETFDSCSSYGKSRAKLCSSLLRRENLRTGCRLDDLAHYLACFHSLCLSSAAPKVILPKAEYSEIDTTDVLTSLHDNA